MVVDNDSWLRNLHYAQSLILSLSRHDDCLVIDMFSLCIYSGVMNAAHCYLPCGLMMVEFACNPR
jgi:hypothetical protein